MAEKGPVNTYQTANLDHPSLLVGWQTHDVGSLSSCVIHFLNETMGGFEIADLNPLGFHSFGGIRFKHDLVQFPVSQFWACEEKNLLLFKSDEPEFEYHRFLKTVLEWAESNFRLRDIYTINGTFSFIPHTQPRRIWMVFNQKELRESLRPYDVEPLTWQGPPAMSSYLLWIARRRGIPGMSLWVEVPFYLAAREDPLAIKTALTFLDRRFGLGLDLSPFDGKIGNQNERMAHLREESEEVDHSIRRLENGEALSEEEQLKLTQEVYQHLDEAS